MAGGQRPAPDRLGQGRRDPDGNLIEVSIYDDKTMQAQGRWSSQRQPT
jgi:hypothetical protein